jgi:hypothetical protein
LAARTGVKGGARRRHDGAGRAYSARGAHDPSYHYDTARLEAFSDGVFAIAITLLIIEIGVPHVGGDETLGHALRQLWPSTLATR